MKDKYFLLLFETLVAVLLLISVLLIFNWSKFFSADSPYRKEYRIEYYRHNKDVHKDRHFYFPKKLE